jgi:hypothetical protein
VIPSYWLRTLLYQKKNTVRIIATTPITWIVNPTEYPSNVKGRRRAPQGGTPMRENIIRSGIKKVM